MLAQVLRRQSRPWARILRDFGSLARPSALVVVGSAILFGVSLIFLDVNPQQNWFQQGLKQAPLVEPQESP